MRPRVLLSLLLIVSFTNLRAQILGDRLVAITNTAMITSVFTPTDSTIFTYQGIMTSNMKTGVINYDTSITYVYNGSSYHNSELSRKSYTAFDSVSLWQQYNWNDSANNWDISADATMNNNFDAISHLILNRSLLYTASPSYSLSYFYDGSNNLIEVLKIGIAGDSQQRTLYTYNGSNMTSALVQNWLATPPPPAMPGFQNYLETDYSYNSLNEDTLKLSKSWNPVTSTWNKDNFTNYYYDASKRNIAIYYTALMAGSGYVSTGRDTITYDANGNVTSITRQDYDTVSHGYFNGKRTTWTYDTTWHVPLLMTTFSWDGSSWVSLNGQDNQTRYYYKTYTNAVPYINKAIGSFNIFPVPAQNMVTIRMMWAEPQAFTVSIYDMEGRLIQQTAESATNNYQHTFSVSDLASGTYLVRIKGTDTEMAQPFTVSK